MVLSSHRFSQVYRLVCILVCVLPSCPVLLFLTLLFSVSEDRLLIVYLLTLTGHLILSVHRHTCVRAQLCSTLCDPMNCTPPGCLCIEFSRQDYWSGLPFALSRDLPDSGIKPTSSALQADSLLLSLGEAPLFTLEILILPRVGASLVAQMVKNLQAMHQTWVRSLAWEDPLEESMATHSSILAWRIPMDRGACQDAVHGVTKESDMTERLSTAQSWGLSTLQSFVLGLVGSTHGDTCVPARVITNRGEPVSLK